MEVKVGGKMSFLQVHICFLFYFLSSLHAYIVKIQIIPIFSPVDVQHGRISLDRADDYSPHPSRQVCLAGHSSHTCRVCVKDGGGGGGLSTKRKSQKTLRKLLNPAVSYDEVKSIASA